MGLKDGAERIAGDFIVTLYVGMEILSQRSFSVGKLFCQSTGQCRMHGLLILFRNTRLGIPPQPRFSICRSLLYHIVTGRLKRLHKAFFSAL